MVTVRKLKVYILTATYTRDYIKFYQEADFRKLGPDGSTMEIELVETFDFNKREGRIKFLEDVFHYWKKLLGQ